jgi:hypothetical protein
VKVEILYISGCPNHRLAVNAVHAVMRQEGGPADIVEIEVKDEATAQQVGFLGSPTIRVNGQDVELEARALSGLGITCRTYVDRGQRTGVPPREWIRAAVREAGGRSEV